MTRRPLCDCVCLGVGGSCEFAFACLCMNVGIFIVAQGSVFIASVRWTGLARRRI